MAARVPFFDPSLALLLLVAGCDPAPPASRAVPQPSAPVATATPVATAKAPARKRSKPERKKPAATAPVAAPAPASCPEDMAAVEGNYCRSVEQRCLEYVVKKGAPDENRCVRFERPTQCVSIAPTPRHMNFCMDRYEYPNRVGEVPLTLVDWKEATRLCETHGKRLCTESEFTFACEGEEMRPYAIGFERDAEKCNIDKPFAKRRIELKPDPLCRADPRCASELARLDGRRKIGESKECVSPFGIYDLNGNVNEWVALPWKDPPHRSALKGGWWGPVRNRCRAIASSHDEKYLGYEVGFRCCKDASDGRLATK
jgi:formylglycine-generating enzyme